MLKEITNADNAVLVGFAALNVLCILTAIAYPSPLFAELRNNGNIGEI